MSAAYILWLRQLKRYMRSRSMIIGSLGQPILYLLAMGFGFGPIYARAGGGNYLQFIAPGIVAMAILFTSMFSGMGVIWDRQFGFLKETLVAPVSRVSIMVGRTLGGATVAAIQGMLVLTISILVGFRPHHWYAVPLAFGVMLLVGIVFTAFGTALASVLEDMQGFQMIMSFLVMPLFFLSGALFPIAGLPPAIGIAARLDPLAYGVDAMRGFLIGESHFGLAMDFAVLLIVSVAITAIGARLFSRIEA